MTSAVSILPDQQLAVLNEAYRTAVRRKRLRALLSAGVIGLIDILVLIPLVLSIIDASWALWSSRELRELLEIVEGMGVILIGWGVALEERGELRDIFGLIREDDETWQAHVDHGCKSIGIGLLVFGLFAEMCIQAIRLPNRIINTEGINEVLVGVGVVFMAISAFILVRHVVALLTLMTRRH